MPFKNQRNSREDNSRKHRSTSTRFKSQGNSNRRNTSLKDGETFGKEEDKTYTKSSKFNKSSKKFTDRPNKFGASKGKFSNNRFEKTENIEKNFKNTARKKFSTSKKAVTTEIDDDGLIRLNRYISNSGICSRRKADELIAAGVISVNGEVVTALGTKVDPAKDEIRYNNERLKRELQRVNIDRGLKPVHTSNMVLNGALQLIDKPQSLLRK